MKYYFMYIGAVLALMNVVWAMPIYPPSFNILLTEDGSYTMMRGDPYANIILSQGNKGRILLHNLEPNTLYSARYSTLHCIQIMTNNNGNANSGQINDSEGYGFIYEWEERMRGGHHAELKEGEASKFSVHKGSCNAHNQVLKGVEDKVDVREMIPSAL